MALYSSGKLVVDNSGNIIPNKYTTRASLTTGLEGYIAYVSDTQDFVFSSNRDPSTGPSGVQYPQQQVSNTGNFRWYKFLSKPMDYKNEIILQQGTVAGGYVGGNQWSQIARVNSVTDVLHEQPQTMSFASLYGAWHSSEWYAYYQQGGTGPASQQCKQDWATWSVTTTSSRPTGGTGPNSWHSGTKNGANANWGMVQQGGSNNSINFNTDSWNTSYGVGNGYYGGGAVGENSISFNMTAGSGGAYKWNFTSMTSSGTFAGEAPNIGGNIHGKPLSTKWYKWFFNANNSSATDKYNVSSDSWTVVANSEYTNGENCPVMAQDWGYWICGYNGNGQNNVSTKTFYQSESTYLLGTIYGQRNQSSGCACYGPMP
jgi:hypothetical protein